MDARPGQFPFYVLLKIRVRQGITTCGGSLINKDWILTAGHCLHDVLGIKAYLGTHLNAPYGDERGPGIFSIDQKDIHLHPELQVSPNYKK